MLLENRTSASGVEQRRPCLRPSYQNGLQGEAANALEAIGRLTDYCRANDWMGYDPYDALNSRLFAPMLKGDWRIPRLLVTQMLKRSPLNLRALLGVPRTANAKAIALFLMAFIKLRRVGLLASGQLVDEFACKLISLRSPSEPYFAWGYNFPWQSRHTLVPPGTPNVVCTAFAGNALLDAYELVGEERYLDAALSAVRYLAERLYWVHPTRGAGFRYPHPDSTLIVHNANLLAAALLSRAWRHSADQNLLALCVDVAQSAVAAQHADGSWYYGESGDQRWIDNFHTGYNLCALSTIACETGIARFDDSVRRGFRFYIDRFVTQEGIAKYFADRTYPIDAHSVAQSVITLVQLQERDSRSIERAGRVLEWALENLWDEKGYFYYQVTRFRKTKIAYMRWSQAWMLLALATFVENAVVKNEWS